MDINGYVGNSPLNELKYGASGQVEGVFPVSLLLKGYRYLSESMAMDMIWI